MNEIEVKKDLYKSKAMAKFSHYEKGNLYYRVELNDGIYQFPIATTENDPELFDKTDLKSGDKKFIQAILDSLIERYEDIFKKIKLSDDLGDTAFDAEIKGSELIRWIGKAIKNETFFKVSSKPVTEDGKIIGYQG